MSQGKLLKIDNYYELFSDLEADLSSANLTRADLSKTNLSGADLRGAHLTEANLTGADLGGANLSGRDLSTVNLTEANLTGADLSTAYLRGAILAEADLKEANLSGADLREANLRGATLIGTDLADADLTGCLIFGISAWRLKLEGAKQQNLIITPWPEPEITVDNIEVAQFDAEVAKCSPSPWKRSRVASYIHGDVGHFPQRAKIASLQVSSGPLIPKQ